MERKRISRLPSANGGNGRDANGRWAKGNPGGPGNPLVQQVQRIRSALINAITPNDPKTVVEPYAVGDRLRQAAATQNIGDSVPADTLGPARRLDR
jgi:hypothetical protein